MTDTHLRFGPYNTPRYEYGSVVMDEMHGLVKIVGTSNAEIPWPLHVIGGGHRVPVLFEDLVAALRVESTRSVAKAWGVSSGVICKWRKALGVTGKTKGGVADMLPALKAEERREKIAAAKRGKARPREVIEAMRKANLGRALSEQQRRNMSKSHKRRGTLPPAAGIPWTNAEDELVRSLTPAEAAKQTGRSLSAVYSRRSTLTINDGRATRWQND